MRCVGVDRPKCTHGVDIAESLQPAESAYA